MHTRTILRCSLLLLLGAPLAAGAAPFGAKNGEWDTTLIKSASGLPRARVSQAAYEKMSPAKRARLANYITLQRGGKVTVNTRTCISSTDTLASLMHDHNRPDCHVKVLKQSANAAEAEVICDGDHPRTSHVFIKSPTPESVSWITDGKGEHDITFHVESQSHWVSASCVNVPGAQVAGAKAAGQKS